jgi:hypothetical protein
MVLEVEEGALMISFNSEEAKIKAVHFCLPEVKK